MDSADKHIILPTSIIFGLLLLYLNSRLPEEVVFPGHVAYCIITFFLTYPECNKLRHFIISFLLSFGDIFFIQRVTSQYEFIGHERSVISANMRVLFLEFVLLFTIIKMMSSKEIYTEFQHPILRTIVFILKGYVKAKGIIGSLQILTGNKVENISEEVFMKGIIICGIQAAIPGIVYALDTFLCRDVPVREISLNGIVTLGKIGIVISGIGMIIEIIQDSFSAAGSLGLTRYSPLFIYAYYLVVYTRDSIRCGNNFTRKAD